MDNSFSSKLQIWEGWTRTIVRDRELFAQAGGLPGPRGVSDFARHLYACESLEPALPPRTEEGVEPYSLQWFLDIEHQRHGGRGRWIPHLLEFTKHAGETLLGLGNGLGTDWLQYARHGAAVVVCSSSAEQLTLTRRNFELRGLTGRFLHTSPSVLPLESASIDVACVCSLLQEGDPRAMVEEVYRVLKPGGKVLAVATAYYDIDYWLNQWFPWRRWLGRPARTGEEPGPLYTSRALKQLFAPFIERRVHKRHLRRSEVPHFWRWLPLPLLERLVGHILILKAFKPLTAAASVRIAA